MGDGLRWQGEDLLLRVRVQPRASRERVMGWQGGALKVALTAPPVEGAANQALCVLLAKLFQRPKGQVSVVQGEASRDKVVRIAGVTQEHARAVLAPWPG